MKNTNQNSLPKFNIEWLNLSDYELGKYLLAYWFGFMAESEGIPINSIPSDYAEKIRIATLTLDSDNLNLVALEKSLRLVANCEPERGGALFRQFISNGAYNEAMFDKAMKGIAFAPGRRKGAVKKTTKYLMGLCNKHPELSAKELYKLACEEAECEQSPFNYDRIDGLLYDGDTEVGIQRFENRLSKAKNRNK